jgi:hypothetical protein
MFVFSAFSLLYRHFQMSSSGSGSLPSCHSALQQQTKGVHMPQPQTQHIQTPYQQTNQHPQPARSSSFPSAPRQTAAPERQLPPHMRPPAAQDTVHNNRLLRCKHWLSSYQVRTISAAIFAPGKQAGASSGHSEHKS